MSEKLFYALVDKDDKEEATKIAEKEWDLDSFGHGMVYGISTVSSSTVQTYWHSASAVRWLWLLLVPLRAASRSVLDMLKCMHVCLLILTFGSYICVRCCYI